MLETLPKSFLDTDLYRSALTHKSSYFENSRSHPHNERLEFLGDAALGLVVAQLLYSKYPENNEGFLTKARANLVNTKTLSEKAKALGLQNMVRVGKSEQSDDGIKQPRILASTLEAVIGAIYLELGMIVLTEFLENLFQDELSNEELLKVSDSDWKSKLQEELQKTHQKTPTYEVVETSGPDHHRTFKVAVLFNENILAHGEGLSRKEAEQVAAKKALEKV